MEKLNAYLPTQSLVYLLICCAGVIVFAVMIILPAERTKAELAAEIQDLQARIEEQRVLNPVFKKLLERAKAERDTRLPQRRRVKLGKEDIGGLTGRLQQMVQEHHLKIEELSPDVNSLSDNAGLLSVSIRAAGRFEDFRDFLTALCGMPALAAVESLEVRARPGTRQLAVKIWLAQE